MRLPAMRLRMLFHKASAGRRTRDRHTFEQFVRGRHLLVAASGR